jgi:hypothetical protein
MFLTYLCTYSLDNQNASHVPSDTNTIGEVFLPNKPNCASFLIFTASPDPTRAQYGYGLGQISPNLCHTSKNYDVWRFTLKTYLWHATGKRRPLGPQIHRRFFASSPPLSTRPLGAVGLATNVHPFAAQKASRLRSLVLPIIHVHHKRSRADHKHQCFCSTPLNLGRI